MRGRRKLSNHSNVFLFCCWLVPYDPIPSSHLFDQVHVARLPDISPCSPFMLLICTAGSSPCWRSNTSQNLWETYRRYQRSSPPFDGYCFVYFVSLFRWIFSDSLDQVQVGFLGDCFGDWDDLAAPLATTQQVLVGDSWQGRAGQGWVPASPLFWKREFPIFRLFGWYMARKSTREAWKGSGRLGPCRRRRRRRGWGSSWSAPSAPSRNACRERVWDKSMTVYLKNPKPSCRIS